MSWDADDYLSSETETRTVTVIHLTRKAALCDIEGDEHWLPFSVVDGLEDADKGDTVEVEIPSWFCDKNGI